MPPAGMSERQAGSRADRAKPALRPVHLVSAARNPRLPAPRCPGRLPSALRPTPAAHDIIAGPWGARAFGRRLPCALGRGGVTRSKREGDGATPAGTHALVGLLWRPDRQRRPAGWAVPIRPGDLWGDDPDEPTGYNQLVRVPYPAGHERLRRADPLYDLVVVSDWNWPDAQPGRGSAIFLHLWRKPRHPTEGCVAFSRRSWRWLLPRIRYETRLIVRR